MSPSALASLGEWLAYLEQLHPKTIALGLERISLVKDRLGLEPEFPIITVAGTNGKGSACAMLEAILSAAGYRSGLYTSPHLLRYNERVRISAAEADDAALCEAFAAVEAAREDTPLTYFEFGTLAALLLFKRAGVDMAVLEVGLGGRLDAVNAFGADCAIVTSVGIDHTEYLGDDREAIGFEKAGIFRQGRPAICAETDVLQSIVDHAARIGADLHLINRDFGFQAEAAQWRFWSRSGWRVALPYPALRGDYQLGNASACLAALEQLKQRLPVSANDIRHGLLQAVVPGRFQVIPGKPQIILDVAHNPHAALALAGNLRRMGGDGKTIAVFGMLKDKDIAGVVEAMKEVIDVWLLADLASPRGAGALHLLQLLQQQGVGDRARTFSSVASACSHACNLAAENDKIVFFGSFLTVADAMRVLSGA